MTKTNRFRAAAAIAAIGMATACAQENLHELSPTADLTTDAEAFAHSRAVPLPGEGVFTQELEREIDGLIADYQANGPTTVENAKARGITLYNWANALAVRGEWIHPDLTALVALTQQGGFADRNPRVLPTFLTGVDNFIEELSLRRNKPDAFGNIEMDVLHPAKVTEHLSVAMTYTVGSEPIVRGGGIVAPNHFRFSQFEYQTEDPTAPNYVTISSTNPQVEFVPDEYPAIGQYSTNLYGNAPRLFFRITSGELTRGDKVTVTFGDRSQGSPGLQTIHYSNSALRYPVWVLTAATENGGIAHSLPEPAVPLPGGEATGVHAFGPALVTTGEKVQISIRAEDKFRNRATSNVPTRWVVQREGEDVATVDSRGEPIVRFDIAFDEPGIQRFTIRSEDGAIIGRSTPVLVQDDPSMRLYFGETHGHSGWAEGLGLVDDYFEFAYEDSRLDFVTLSEHDLWMDLSEWAQMKRAVDRHAREGEFVTMMGYEYTADPPYGGHHNVLFRNSDKAVLASLQQFPDVELLYAALNRTMSQEDVTIVPHAHQPGDWTRSDRGLERLVEIVSYHGTFEWFGKRYLDQGWEVGLIGSSDDHVGSPGYRPRAFGRNGSDNFGGLAAVYAPSLSNDAIFDALRSRHTYATNGARMILQAKLNERRMGTRLPAAAPVRTLRGAIHGDGAIASVTLVKNGVPIETIDYQKSAAPGHIEIALEFESQPPTRRRSLPDATYIGQVSLSGMTAKTVAAPVAEALNSLSEYARPDVDRRTIDFRLRSGGRRNTIMIEPGAVTDLADATLSIDLSKAQMTNFDATTLAPIQVSLADLANGPLKVALDGENGLHSLTVRRVAVPSAMDRSFVFTDNSAPRIGDYYFVRVRQVDGGMAWSSPWWIGRPMKKDSPV